MRAMVLSTPTSLGVNPSPLELRDVPIPDINGNEILIKVSVCGVCHTELDIIEARTPPLSYPIILGHQVIGTVYKKGYLCKKLNIGDRIGIGWIYSSCGICSFCKNGNENLCENFNATGRDANGGYAEYMKVEENFAYIIPDIFTDIDAAPLLCAGGVGYRSLKLANIKNGDNLGLTGFGASGHIVLKLVRYIYPDSKLFVFARNVKEREFAYKLGACWVGDIDKESPEKMQSIIDTTPAWKPVVCSLKNLQKGGRLVINAIRKEDADKDYLTNISYNDHIWMEKEIKSVANVTRNDIETFLGIASKIPLIPETEVYGLEDANKALTQLKKGSIKGAKVLVI